MGTMLDLETVIQYFKKGDSVDFIAEVFWEELQFLLSRDLADSIIIENHGMNSRVASKDILDVEVSYKPVGNALKEFVVLHLSRNSIYHQLPEFLFHPLVISSPSMSNREVVEAIKENRRLERKNIDFLKFFDTILFSEKVAITKRYLSFLADNNSVQNFIPLAKRLLRFDKKISPQSLYWLFLMLCSAEGLKENFDVIEKLICLIVDVKTKIQLIPKKIANLPFDKVNIARLGVNFGADGEIKSEIDDVQIIILLDEPIEDYATIRELRKIIHSVLEFFVYAGREIHITFELKNNKGCVLSVSHLGCDSYVA